MGELTLCVAMTTSDDYGCATVKMRMRVDGDRTMDRTNELDRKSLGKNLMYFSITLILRVRGRAFVLKDSNLREAIATSNEMLRGSSIV